MVRMKEIEINGRKVGIHFNGDYFLDDDNNVFLQRHPGTRQWFLMVRDGYAKGIDVAALNARIQADNNVDYGFRAAWIEYEILICDILRRDR